MDNLRTPARSGPRLMETTRDAVDFSLSDRPERASIRPIWQWEEDADEGREEIVAGKCMSDCDFDSSERSVFARVTCDARIGDTTQMGHRP